MGMSATVSQMSDALSSSRQNISDDKCVIDGLIGEAQNMMTNLIGRLDQFVSDDNIQQQKHVLTTLHVTLVRGVAGTVEMMGLEDIDRLKAFLPNNNDSLPTMVTTSHDELDELNSSDTDLDTADDGSDGSVVEESDLLTEDSQTLHFEESSAYAEPMESDVITAGVASTGSFADVNSPPRPKANPDLLVRKLTWACPASQSKKPLVKSLVDIQKEELSYREHHQADGT
jgi:hypothetical protein